MCTFVGAGNHNVVLSLPPGSSIPGIGGTCELVKKRGIIVLQLECIGWAYNSLYYITSSLDNCIHLKGNIS